MRLNAHCTIYIRAPSQLYNTFTLKMQLQYLLNLQALISQCGLIPKNSPAYWEATANTYELEISLVVYLFTLSPSHTIYSHCRHPILFIHTFAIPYYSLTPSPSHIIYSHCRHPILFIHTLAIAYYLSTLSPSHTIYSHHRHPILFIHTVARQCDV
jgi:hypothetical protein